MIFDSSGSRLSMLESYTLMRIYPTDIKQLADIKYLEDPQLNVSILKNSRSLNDSTDILIPPQLLQILEDFVRNAQLRYDLKPNYGRSFENLDRVPRRRAYGTFNVFEYHSPAAILEHMESLAKRYPNLMTLQNLGTSYEGRTMKLAKISANNNAGNPIIFVDAGIHAREWVAPAMAMYLIQRLVSDPEARYKELKGVDWYILPLVNPDGYEFTRSHRKNRMWRKTRSKSDGYPTCFGVDGNRNYGFKWAVSGVSNNPCDTETYAGPKPFSEVETLKVRNIMMENSKRIKLYVSLHAYGQYLVYPWGYTGDYLPTEWKRLDTMARLVSNAVQRAGGQPFKVLSAGKWYAAAGGSDDFAFGAVGIPYSYTMELTTGHEFIFPERLLRTVLPQFYEGFKVFASQIRKEFPTRQSFRNVENRNSEPDEQSDYS